MASQIVKVLQRQKKGILSCDLSEILTFYIESSLGLMICPEEKGLMD